MRWRPDATETIINELKENFDYTIPLEPEPGAEGMLMNFIFSEGDSGKMNAMVEHLLNLNDEDVNDCIWKNFPQDSQHYKFGETLAKIARERKAVMEECFRRDGNIYNRTPDIPFESGVITPVCNKHRDILRDAMFVDKDNAQTERDRYEIDCFIGGVSNGNRSQGDEPSFVILNESGEPVGYIKLTKGGYFSMRSTVKTFNLEYYTLPEHRRKGYMKQALKAFVRAASEQRIQVVTKDPLFHYGVQTEVLPLKMLNALILKDNASSVKTIEAVGGFEKLGTIKWVSEAGFADDVIEEAFCYTKVF